MTASPSIHRRIRAAGLHFLLSAGVAGAVAWVVFRIWFPPPYAEIAGGLSLFGLLVGVDVALGPLLTAVAASPAKPKAELRRDLAIIVAIQLAAFGYGLHSISLARPVHVVFEIDRFRVVTAADIDPQGLPDAPPSLQSLPWSGPTWLAAVKPTDPAEQLRMIDLGLAGVELSMIPKQWRAYDDAQRDAAWRAARPVSALRARYPQSAGAIDDFAARAGQPAAALRFLPLVSRRSSWVVLIAPPDARVVGHLPFDGFF